MGVLLHRNIRRDLMYRPLDAMADATRLTRAGKLTQATHLIQRALRGLIQPERPPAPAEPVGEAPVRPIPEVEDIAFRDLPVPPGIATTAPEPGPAPDQGPKPEPGPGTFDAHEFA